MILHALLVKHDVWFEHYSRAEVLLFGDGHAFPPNRVSIRDFLCWDNGTFVMVFLSITSCIAWVLR